MSMSARFPALLTLGILLTACSQTTAPRAATHAFTTTVPVAATDSVSTVEATHGGHVVAWHPEAGFAVLGLSSPSGSTDTVSTQTLASEPNVGALEAGGATSAWNAPGLAASGRAYFWGGGRAYFWGGGRAYFWGGGAGVVGGVAENATLWQRTRLAAAWALAPRLGEGVTVAVIDTGLDQTHEAFQNSLAPAADRHDFVDGDASPQEEGTLDDPLYGHGTNVAGIILQVAPHARILPLRALRPDGSGDTTAVVQAIDWAVAHGAQVINLSLGSVQKTGVLKKMIEYATDQGVYVIASSGNTGDRRITYPARYSAGGGTLGSLSVSVGSVDASDHKSAFSTYGKELMLTAPGELVYGPVPGNLLSAWSGTSMAAPMAAGALALALGQPLKVRAGDLPRTLVSTAAELNTLNPEYKDQLGGRLDIGAFIQAAVQP